MDPSAYLLQLGREVLAPYAALPGVACAAITGSAAEGHADEHSDLDTTIYYDTLPPEAEIRAVRERVCGGPLIWSLGSYADGEFIESFRVRGVECQIGHTTVARWEADMDRILRGEEPGSPLHKAMSGTIVSIAVSGDERLEAWKARLRDYPDVLRLAMVRHHLKFFPLWGITRRMETRDADFWFRQVLVEASFNVIGVAAGLSRKYFTPFQFKRARLFLDTLTVAPARLADRLDALWDVTPMEAAGRLRGLVEETVTLVEREVPEVDTAAARKALTRDDKPWSNGR